MKRKIVARRIPSSAIRLSGRPMNGRYRERILRDEFENFSIRRAYLIADAVGIKVRIQIVDET